MKPHDHVAITVAITVALATDAHVLQQTQITTINSTASERTALSTQARELPVLLTLPA